MKRDWDSLPLIQRLWLCFIADYKGWRKRRAIDRAWSVLWNNGYEDDAERLREISDKMWDDAVPPQK